MSTRRDAVLDRYELLTQRTFLVLDTEFATSADGSHVISLAIVPVVRGKRAKAAEELYLVMNPGVPIDAATSRIHGFTDADVARKRTFAFYARRIIEFLDAHAQDRPVLVSHTGTDIHLLRTELTRLETAQPDSPAGIGLADLPNLPLMDTSVLHRHLGVPGVTASGVVKLTTLCDLFSVQHGGVHNALHDARATAEVLLAMLLHAAGEFSGRYAYDDLDGLLANHGRGTTLAPAVGMARRSRGFAEPRLPAEHAARHARTDILLLDPAATTKALEDWLATAAACVRLRCRHLPHAAALAGPNHAKALWEPLWAMVTGATEPGQAGTALGALMRLLNPHHASEDHDRTLPGDDPASSPHGPAYGLVPNTTSGALTHREAMPWWRRNKDAVAATIPCAPSGSGACPDCRAGHGCPRDRFYEPIARISTFGRHGRLDKANIKDRLFGRAGGTSTPKRAYHDWTDPRCVAYMVWLVVSWAREHDQLTTAGKHLAQAQADDYHLHDPLLARMVCETLADTVGLTAASAEAQRALTARTSDPAWDALATWLTWREHAAARAACAAQPRLITVERLARPDGRTNPNPYLA